MRMRAVPTRGAAGNGPPDGPSEPPSPETIEDVEESEDGEESQEGEESVEPSVSAVGPPVNGASASEPRAKKSKSADGGSVTPFVLAFVPGYVAVGWLILASGAAVVAALGVSVWRSRWK